MQKDAPAHAEGYTDTTRKRHMQKGTGKSSTVDTEQWFAGGDGGVRSGTIGGGGGCQATWESPLGFGGAEGGRMEQDNEL